MSETDLADVWARSLDGLADLQIKPHQRAWLKLTRPLGLVENTALIATPNEFVKEQLETRLRALVTHALSAELGRSIQLAVTVDPASAAGPAAAEYGTADYVPPAYGELAEDPVRSFSDVPARNFVTAPASGDFERLAPDGPGGPSAEHPLPSDTDENPVLTVPAPAPAPAATAAPPQDHRDPGTAGTVATVWRPATRTRCRTRRRGRGAPG